MGYIGLLLNAPYKIDSRVWMRLILIGFVNALLSSPLLLLFRSGYINQGKSRG
jgi:hypothetical protein